jgi:hypothetical protein
MLHLAQAFQTDSDSPLRRCHEAWGRILEAAYQSTNAVLGEHLIALGPECAPLTPSPLNAPPGATGRGDTLYLATPISGSSERLRGLDSAVGSPSGSWAVVAGADPDAVRFALAKLRARPRPTPVRWAALDGVSRRIVVDGEERPWKAEHIIVALSQARTLVVIAHGEGAHANLEDVVICGVLGDREKAGGRSIPGGCIKGRRCKRARPGVVVIPAHSVRATEVVLVSCNSFMVAPELYPSNNSLLLGLVDGYAGTVVGTLAPVEVGSRSIEYVIETLMRSETWSAFVRRLNGPGLTAGPFVVHGRPSDRPPLLAIGPAAVQPVWPVSRSQLEGAARRVESAGLLEAGFTSWLQQERTVEPFADLLRTMSRVRTRATLRLQGAWSAQASGPIARPLPPSRLVDELVQDAREWTDAVHRIVARCQPYGDLSGALVYAHRPTHRVRSRPCPRCATTTEIVTLSTMSAGPARRRLWRCPLCGDLDNWIAGALRCRLLVTSVLTPGDELCFGVRLTGEERPRPPWRRTAPVHIAVAVRDKARGAVVWDSVLTMDGSTRSSSVATGRRGHEFTPELHTVSALAIGQFSVAASRRRFARGVVH